MGKQLEKKIRYKEVYRWSFLGHLEIKQSTCQCRRGRLDSWVGKIPWRREWQATPGFLPVEFHGPRSPVGYSPRGRKESDTTEWLTLSLFIDIAESLCCSPETNTTLLINYTPIWNKSFFLKAVHLSKKSPFKCGLPDLTQMACLRVLTEDYGLGDNSSSDFAA